MNHVPSAEIDDPALKQEPFGAPDAVGPNGVGEGHPQWHEQHPCMEVHPPEERPGDEDDGDGGENKLKEDEGGPRKKVRIILLQEVVLAEGEVGLAQEGDEPVAERHMEPPGHPADEYDSEGVEGHEGRVHCPLLLDDAAVEDDEARHALEADEGRRSQLP